MYASHVSFPERWLCSGCPLGGESVGQRRYLGVRVGAALSRIPLACFNLVRRSLKANLTFSRSTKRTFAGLSAQCAITKCRGVQGVQGVAAARGPVMSGLLPLLPWRDRVTPALGGRGEGLFLHCSCFWKFTRCLGDNGLQLRTFTVVVEHFGAAHDAFFSRRYARSNRCHVTLRPSVCTPKEIHWSSGRIQVLVLTWSHKFIDLITEMLAEACYEVCFKETIYPSVPAIRGRAGLRRQRHGPDTPRPRGEGPSRSCWPPPPRLWDPHILSLQPGCGPPAQVPSDPPTRLSTALGSAGDARLQMVQPGC
ncbi:unnamed protein product [Gadus morhua 'NCC']